MSKPFIRARNTNRFASSEDEAPGKCNSFVTLLPQLLQICNTVKRCQASCLTHFPLRRVIRVPDRGFPGATAAAGISFLAASAILPRAIIQENCFSSGH